MTPANRKNFYVQPGPQVQKIVCGLKQLEAACQAANRSDAWIVAARKDYFKEEYIKAAVGDECSALLYNSQPGKYGSITLHPYLGTKPQMSGDENPVLAVFLTADQLSKFDELYSVPTLIVVPFATAGIEDVENAGWLKKRGPEIIGP